MDSKPKKQCQVPSPGIFSRFFHDCSGWLWFAPTSNSLKKTKEKRPKSTESLTNKRGSKIWRIIARKRDKGKYG